MDVPQLNWVMTVDPNAFNARWYAAVVIRGHAMTYFIEQVVRGGEIAYAVEHQFGWSTRVPVAKNGFAKSIGDAKDAAAAHLLRWIRRIEQGDEVTLARTGTAGQS